MRHQLGLHVCLHSRNAQGKKSPELEEEKARLSKGVQLMLCAPLVAITVLEVHHRQLPDPYKDLQDGHAVLVMSEEQFKVFALPEVSTNTEFKLMAVEGCCMYKLALATFAGDASEDYAKTCLACLNNLDDIHVSLLPGLWPRVHFSSIQKEDISCIVSCILTCRSQSFDLISLSEFEWFSLSAQNITEPLGSLDTSWPHDAACASYRLPSCPSWARLRDPRHRPGPLEPQWKPWSCLQQGSWHPRATRGHVLAHVHQFSQQCQHHNGHDREHHGGGQARSPGLFLRIWGMWQNTRLESAPSWWNEEGQNFPTTTCPAQAGIQDPWLLSGLSHWHTPANLQAPAGPADPGPRVGAQDSTQSLWSRFRRAPPQASGYYPRGQVPWGEDHRD